MQTPQFEIELRWKTGQGEDRTERFENDDFGLAQAATLEFLAGVMEADPGATIGRIAAHRRGPLT